MRKIALPFLLFALAAQLPSPALAQAGLALGERPIKRAEVIAFTRRQFAEIDRNRDGSIGQSEYQAYRAVQPARAEAGLGYIGRSRFEKSDMDGNGRISLAEAQARPLHFFDMADANGDGIASVREQSLASLFLGR